ncbi:hypothetical protein GCM10020256_54910 [Streptomyces thermocoprophilus]
MSAARTSPAVRRPRQRHRRQGPSQPGDVDPARGQSVVEPAVPATVFAHQRQFHQRPDWTIGAQHRVRELEQGVRTPGQTGMELTPEA